MQTWTECSPTVQPHLRCNGVSQPSFTHVPALIFTRLHPGSCQWNIPGDYSNSLFDSCTGDSAEPMGIYGNSTFRQGQPSTPGPHPKPSTSGCQTATIAYALGLPLESPTSSSDAQLATSSLYRSPSEAAATSTPNTAPPGWPIFWSDKVVVGMLLGFGSLIYGACLVF